MFYAMNLNVSRIFKSLDFELNILEHHFTSLWSMFEQYVRTHTERNITVTTVA